MRHRRDTSVIIACLLSATLSAQEQRFGGWLGKWQDKGLSIRQTFDGTKNEQNPANLAIVSPSYVIDLGVKLVDWQPFRDNPRHSLVFSPVSEWHRTNTPKKVNVTSGKLSIEYAYTNLKVFDFQGNVVDEAGGKLLFGPLLTIKLGTKRDELLHKSGEESSANITIVSTKPGWPNKKNVDHDQHETYLWAPSIGIEAYGDSTIRQPEEVKSVDVTLARARVFVIGYPLNSNGERRNEISVEYTQRWHIGGQNTLRDSHYGSAQATRYFDAKRRVGVGVGYDHGRDPNIQFLPVRRVIVSAKFNL
jgi:hypothetical protein